ncbi:MAG: hypothetical protein M3326_01990, partial [Actinomycetota bacterium]|nr:hypothetical protein [Actinomycetota bacterium]
MEVPGRRASAVHARPGLNRRGESGGLGIFVDSLACKTSFGDDYGANASVDFLWATAPDRASATRAE